MKTTDWKALLNEKIKRISFKCPDWPIEKSFKLYFPTHLRIFTPFVGSMIGLLKGICRYFKKEERTAAASGIAKTHKTEKNKLQSCPFSLAPCTFRMPVADFFLYEVTNRNTMARNMQIGLISNPFEGFLTLLWKMLIIWEDAIDISH